MIIENYKQSWKFIKDSRIYLWIIAALFFASAVFGFLFPVFFLDYINKFMEQISAQTEGLNFIQLFLFIFSNNIKTAFIGLFSGILAGIIPIAIVLFNGYVLGFVANRVVLNSGVSVLWRLLPHGVFEIPALILSLGLGLRMGWFIFKEKGKRMKELSYSLINSAKVFIYLIIPLLVIAAIIETALIVLIG